MALATNACKNCGNRFMGKYCNQCGEKVYTEHDKAIGHILEEGLHFITHFEGKFFVTLKSILFHPGKLSLEYCAGIRKKYFKPLSFFLLLVILYLLFPILKGLNMELTGHMDNVYYGSYATAKINEAMSTKGWSLEQATEHFAARSGKVSKFLLFIIIPVMAAVSWAALRRKKKLFFDHFIFATEMASFALLWGFLIMPLLVLLLQLIFVPLGGGFLFEGETFLSILLMVPFAVYVFIGSARFYQLSRWGTFAFSALFITVFVVFMLTLYKFLLFFITMLFLR
jgi:hypothetical protein